jgi:hypothetical protein
MKSNGSPYFCAAIAATLLTAAAASTQAAISFEHRYGEADKRHFGAAVAAVEFCTPTGGAVLLGTTTVAGKGAYALVRSAANGSVLWEKRYEMDSASGQAKDIIELRDGSGFVVAGQLRNDLLLMKVDCDGEVIWIHQYGQSDNVVPTKVIEATAGSTGLIVAGSIRRGADLDGLLLRTDESGMPLWIRSYDAGGDEGFYSAVEATIVGETTGDIVAAGGRAVWEDEFFPLVVRVASDGTVQAALHGAVLYQSHGQFTSVIELKTPPRAGGLVLAGNLSAGGLSPILLAHTASNPRVVVRAHEYMFPDRHQDAAEVREIIRSTANLPAGALAIAGSAFHRQGYVLHDPFLLAVAATDFAPFWSEMYGDHRGQGEQAWIEWAVGLAAHPEGFWLAGGAQQDFRRHTTLISTDRRGRTNCSLEARVSGLARKLPYTLPRLSVREEASWTIDTPTVTITTQSSLTPTCDVIPTIVMQPDDALVRVGGSATFAVTADSPQLPLAYQWQRDGVDIAGANMAAYSVSNVARGDDGARFRCRVRNVHGAVSSREAILRVNAAPVGTITAPAQGATYGGGDMITYAGTGIDREDGTLPPGAFVWRVDFHHDGVVDPVVPTTGGVTRGSFVVPTRGPHSPNAWYRIHLGVTDSLGDTHSTFRDLLPRTSRVTITTVPPGLDLRIDGQPAVAPVAFTGVVGMMRTLEVATTQTSNGVPHYFHTWSDGGAARHDIATPATDTTYTASYLRHRLVIMDARTPEMSGGDPSVASAISAVAFFEVILEPASSETVIVHYRTANGTATAGLDYQETMGTLTFVPGTTRRWIGVGVFPDELAEPTERFQVLLSRPEGAALADGEATGTILDGYGRPW